MKMCGKCKIEKPFSEFHKNSSKKDGLAGYCKTCAKTRNAEYYRATPERNPQRQKSAAQKRLLARKFVSLWLYTHPCVDCGESDPLVLEFDHVRGKKKKAISTMVGAGMGLAAIREEVAKCEVRCANCHRRVTRLRGEWYFPTYNELVQVTSEEITYKQYAEEMKILAEIRASIPL